MQQHNNDSIPDGSRLDLDLLLSLQEKPAPFTPGEPLFWDDPHISAQMLQAHLEMAGMWRSRAFGRPARTWFWKRGSIIRKNPFTWIRRW